MPGRPLHVVGSGLGKGLPVSVGQLAHDTARYAGDQHAGWQPDAGQDHAPRGDERPRAYSGPAEDDRPDADQRARLDVRAVHGGVMTETDPVLQHRGLARVYVQAAQILDIALGADDDVVVVGAQHGPVPD